jgi:IS605 OrfB family transposase
VNITLKCKLAPNNEQHQQLLDVMKTFNLGCNWVSEFAFKNKIFNKIKIQQQVYYELKQRFNLSSQMAIRVIGKVADSYKNWKNRDKVHIFKETGAIDYDARNFSIKDNLMSISVLGGRTKIPFYSKNKLEKVASQCELYFDKIKNRFYVNLVSEVKEEVPIQTNNFLGVDLGIINLATCSDGEVVSGEKVESYRKKITRLKSRLQTKGTKSAKKHLKKISKKETLFKKDVNHCISKKLVAKAKALGVGLKLEALKFNKPKNPVMKFNKKLRDNNGKLGKWAFGQLRNFISYKAKVVGIPVLLVNPAYTSQKCSQCGHTCNENRLTQESFKCLSCGYEVNADYNASINISRAEINQPIVATRKSELQAPAL